jgi:hypothetical protein
VATVPRMMENGVLEVQAPSIAGWRIVMDHYAGIDVSLELSSICIVDAKGKIVKERFCCKFAGGAH